MFGRNLNASLMLVIFLFNSVISANWDPPQILFGVTVGLQRSEEYLGTYQTSMMEPFCQNNNG